MRTENEAIAGKEAGSRGSNKSKNKGGKEAETYVSNNEQNSVMHLKRI